MIVVEKGTLRISIDEWKDGEKRKNHGISLVEASGVFDDPDCWMVENYFYRAEQLWCRVGMIGPRFYSLFHLYDQKKIESSPAPSRRENRPRGRSEGTTSATSLTPKQIRELTKRIERRGFINLSDPDAPELKPGAFGFPFRDRHKYLDKHGRLKPQFRRRSA
jgi:uncharacterized DUF497 family protein